MNLQDGKPLELYIEIEYSPRMTEEEKNVSVKNMGGEIYEFIKERKLKKAYIYDYKLAYVNNVMKERKKKPKAKIRIKLYFIQSRYKDLLRFFCDLKCSILLFHYTFIMRIKRFKNIFIDRISIHFSSRIRFKEFFDLLFR